MLFTKIKKSLKKPYSKYLNGLLLKKYNNKYESKIIFKSKYKLVRGTVRPGTDYDEGWILFLSNKAKIIFDIGCNVGYSTLLMTQSTAQKKIFAVEPNPYSLSIAAENLIINDLASSVTFISRAAYNSIDESIKLWTIPGPFAAASTDVDFSESGFLADHYITVKTTTLDHIAANYKVYPDLVKIDVEGVENAVLEGAVKIASKKMTQFIVEVHSSKSLSIIENTEKILLWCKNNDYIAYYLSQHIKLDKSSIIARRGRYHLLLIHRDAKYPVGLDKINQSDNINNSF